MLDHSTDLHVRAIMRTTGEEINAVRRELRNLQDIGILIAKRRGNKLFYSVNRDSLLLPELTNLFVKTNPEIRYLHKMLVKHPEHEAVYVFNSFFKPAKRKVSDNPDIAIQVLIIGEINAERLSRTLEKVETKLGREIHVAVMTRDDIAVRYKKRDAFLLNILVRDKILLFGDPSALDASHVPEQPNI